MSTDTRTVSLTTGIPARVVRTVLNLHWLIIITYSPSSTWCLFLVVFMRFGNCVMKYHYNSIQNIFTALKILCTLHFHFSFHPKPWQPLIFFTVSLVMPFPECHVVGIILYVAFSDWLLSCCSMYLRFVCIFFFFMGLIAHFFLVLSDTSLSGCTAVYLFTYWRASSLLPGFAS